MKKWFFLLIILIAVIFDTAILSHLRIFNVNPNLLLIIIVAASLCFELRWALFFSILAGALKDIFCANAIGINVLIFALLSLLVIKLSREIPIDNNLTFAALIFIAVFLSDIIIRLAYVYLGKYIPLGIFLRIAFLESLYTMLISPLVFKIIKPEFNS